MLKAARLSAIRFVQGVISDFDPDAGIGIDYVDWDAHADIKALPNTDLAGLAGFAITDQGNMTEVYFAVVISTYSDPNLLRMVDFTDRFFSAMRAGKRFEILDPADGSSLGWALFTTGTSCSPLSRADVRSTQTITCSAVVAVTD